MRSMSCARRSTTCVQDRTARMRMPRRRRLRTTLRQGGNGEQPADNAQGNSGQNAPSGTGRISLEEARDIALARVEGATASNISIELDHDDGWYVYEGEIFYNGMEYEFEIDADSGNILKWEEERW